MEQERIPRRAKIDQFTPSERAIWDAIQAVEKEGCHPLLTEAVILLQQAKDKLSDYVDENLVAAPELEEVRSIAAEVVEDWQVRRNYIQCVINGKSVYLYPEEFKKVRVERGAKEVVVPLTQLKSLLSVIAELL